MGEAARLSNGESKGKAIRDVAVLVESRVASSPSSRPEIRRLLRGRSKEEAAGVELVRTLLDIAGQAGAYEWMHVGCRLRRAWEVLLSVRTDHASSSVGSDVVDSSLR